MCPLDRRRLQFDGDGGTATVGLLLGFSPYWQQACDARHPSEGCMVVDGYTEGVVRLLMRRDPLDSRKLMDSEARVLAELVKRHVDDDEFPTHLWKVTKGKKWTAFNAALRGAGHIDA